MELGTDTTARIAADILIAALHSKALTPPEKNEVTKVRTEEIAEAFKIIHRAVYGGTRPPSRDLADASTEDDDILV